MGLMMLANNGKEKKLYLINVAANCYLALSALLFGVYLFAPILGGRFFVKSLIVYASWIGTAVLMKVYVSKIRNQNKIKPFEYIFFTLYLSGCMFLWFPLYFAAISSGCIIIALTISYKKYARNLLDEK